MYEVVNVPSCTVFRICPTEEAATAVCRAYPHLPLSYERLPDIGRRS